MHRFGTVVPVSALTSTTSKSGTFAAALTFLDWLHKTSQTAWQLLPLHQTQLEIGSKSNHASSPYQGYGIGLNPRYLNSQGYAAPSDSQIQSFMSQNSYWLSDYALFCALTDYFQTDDWSTWTKDIRTASPSARDAWRVKLSKEYQNEIVTQYYLHTEFQQVRAKAKSAGIILLGDFPYYLSYKSPLVWRYQHLFNLDSSGHMQVVSGAPNRSTSIFGRQVWGHPLYNWQIETLWPELEGLFKIRLWYLANLFDWYRFDHAKGLYFFGSMNLKHPSQDKFIAGPGAPMLKTLVDLSHSLGMEVFAEDTGDKEGTLIHDLKKLHIPGIRVLTYGQKYARISSYPRSSIAYTSTPDTNTLLAFISEDLTDRKRQKLAVTAGITQFSSSTDLAAQLRQAILNSPAQISLIPIQDWLLTKDRINIPGTEKDIEDPNWRYTLLVPVENLPLL
jgi:4-alpha-glucanotransferase